MVRFIIMAACTVEGCCPGHFTKSVSHAVEAFYKQWFGSFSVELKRGHCQGCTQGPYGETQGNHHDTSGNGAGCGLT